jgi:hypothetical protein
VLAAHDQLATCTDAALAATLQSVVSARAQLAQLQQQEEAVQRARRRQQWVHQGERPGPAMRHILKPPKGASYIPGLRAPGSGHLVRDSVRLARSLRMISLQSRKLASDSWCAGLRNDADAEDEVDAADDEADAEDAKVLSDSPLDDDDIDDAVAFVAPLAVDAAVDAASASAAKLVPDEEAADCNAEDDDEAEEEEAAAAAEDSDSDEDDEDDPIVSASMLSCPRRTSSALAASNTVLASAHARSGVRITSL